MNFEKEKKMGLAPDIHPMFANIHDDLVMTPEDVSHLTGMSVQSVRRWCRDGKVDCYNFGGKYMIVGKDFKAFMARAKVRSQAIRRLISP